MALQANNAGVDLQDLRWAIIAAQHKSLRQAAEILNIRQSTLSRRLRDIELRLGTELFERSKGGTRPTAAAQDFLLVARRIIIETEAAFSRLKARSRGDSGHLTIGVYASLSTGNLRATLAEHHRRFPDVDVQTVDGGHDGLLCGLVDNAIDVSVMTMSNVKWDDRMLPLWAERVVVALPADHRLSKRSAIGWSDLITEQVLLPRPYVRPTG